MVGCHFTKEEVVKLQKGLRFRFLESQNLERESFFETFRFCSPEFGRGDGCGVFGQLTIDKAIGAVCLLFHLSCELPSFPRVASFQICALNSSNLL